jgi:tetratricopeptide (TPR) repeat protein
MPSPVVKGAMPYAPKVPDINPALLEPAPTTGSVPRKPQYDHVDITPSGKGLQNTSPLEAEHDGDANYENATTDRNRRQEMESRMRRKPNARSIRYRPVQNDPRVDPLDKGYENWLKSVRQTQDKPGDVDPEYEQFVKDISVLLFSLGQKQLSVDTKEMLEQIPADSLQDPGRSLELLNPVNIGRGDSKDPFPPADQEYDKSIGPDVGMNLQVKAPSINTSNLLEMGYDALMSGQVEGAVAIYKQIVEADPGNKQGLFGLATSYHRGGQLSEARSTYIDLLKLYPDYWPAMNNFLVLASEEAPEDALKELRQLEQINPEFSPIAAQIGMVYLQLGRLPDAVKYLSRAVILAPDNLGYRYNLAIVLDHAGYKAQAIRLYQQLLAAKDEGKELPESSQRIRERLAFILSNQQIQ